VHRKNGTHHGNAGLSAQANLGVVLEARGKYEEAARAMADAMRDAEGYLPEEHWLRASFAKVRGASLVGLNRYSEAEPLLLRALATFESRFGGTHERTQRTLEVLVRMYAAWGRPAEARRYQQRLQ